MQSFNQVLSLGPSILSAFLSLYLPTVYFLDCKEKGLSVFCEC